MLKGRHFQDKKKAKSNKYKKAYEKPLKTHLKIPFLLNDSIYYNFFYHL